MSFSFEIDSDWTEDCYVYFELKAVWWVLHLSDVGSTPVRPKVPALREWPAAPETWALNLGETEVHRSKKYFWGQAPSYLRVCPGQTTPPCAHPPLANNRELKQRRLRRQREPQKSNRFRLAKQQLCERSRFLHEYDVKLPNFPFYGGREHMTTIFFFLLVNFLSDVFTSVTVA